MLNYSQRSVLKVINDHCIKRDSCLISPSNLIAFINQPKKVNKDNINSILQSLDSGDYVDVILTTQNGEPIYCITLKKKGKNYKQEYQNEISAIKNRIILAVLGACVSFIVGRILVLIFT